MENAKIRYYLEPNRKKNREVYKQRRIMAEVSYGFATLTKTGKKIYHPFRISLKKSIEPEKFGLKETNFKLDHALFAKTQNNNSSIRRAMSSLENAIERAFSDFEQKEQLPPPNQFKHSVEVILGRNKVLVEPQPSILEFLYDRIKSDKQKLDRGVQGARTSNTIKTYTTLARHIENYQLVTGDTLRFESFDVSTYWKFFDILDDILKGEYKIENPNQKRKQRVQKHGFLRSSIRKIQVSLLNMYKDAIKKGVKTTFDPSQDDLLVKREQSSKNLYILEEELQAIIDADVTYDPPLQLAKEYIIIASLTASRNETMNGLYMETLYVNNNADKYFTYFHSKHNKTKSECFVPVFKPVKEILDNNNGQFPKFYSNDKTNKNLKKLFDLVGLERPVTETLRTYRSGTITTSKLLSELISSHDAKKTFTSILANYKIPETIVTSVTHPDRPSQNKMYDVYNKQTLLDKARIFVSEINKIESKIFCL